MSERPTFADARQVAAAVLTPFIDGEVDQVMVVSTRFRSAGTQTVEVAPAAAPGRPPGPGRRGGRRRGGGLGPGRRPQGYTEFEPEAAILLESLAPRAAETEIFGALLEGSASEVTARQRAMAAATDNAGELIKKYSRIMNRARQDTITTEIMEIVGGAEALRAGTDEDAGGTPSRCRCEPPVRSDPARRRLRRPTHPRDPPHPRSRPRMTTTAPSPDRDVRRPPALRAGGGHRRSGHRRRVPAPRPARDQRGGRGQTSSSTARPSPSWPRWPSRSATAASAASASSPPTA